MLHLVLAMAFTTLAAKRLKLKETKLYLKGRIYWPEGIFNDYFAKAENNFSVSPMIHCIKYFSSCISKLFRGNGLEEALKAVTYNPGNIIYFYFVKLFSSNISWHCEAKRHINSGK